MAISRDMTATEANILNYIKKIRNKRNASYSGSAQTKISLWQENNRKYH